MSRSRGEDHYELAVLSGPWDKGDRHCYQDAGWDGYGESDVV